MKKYIFLFAVLGMIFTQSALAGADTDRICDEGNEGRNSGTISVNYPGRTVEVDSVWKETVLSSKSQNNATIEKLYYMVNIYDMSGEYVEKGALYEYNCETKTPKQLSLIQSKNKGLEASEREYYFSIGTIADTYILISEGFGGMADIVITDISIFDISTNRIVLRSLNIESTGTSAGLTNPYALYKGKDGFFYYIETGYSLLPEMTRSTIPYVNIYKIDPKTRKITQL